MQTFEELSDIFSDHNNYLTSRELLMRVSSNFISYLISEGLVKFWCLNVGFDIFNTFVLLGPRTPKGSKGSIALGRREEEMQNILHLYFISSMNLMT